MQVHSKNNCHWYEGKTGAERIFFLRYTINNHTNE